MKEDPDVKAAQALKLAGDELASARYAERRKILALDKFYTFNAYVAAGFTPEQALLLVK